MWVLKSSPNTGWASEPVWEAYWTGGKRPIGPFGETFTWPSASSGDVPTKKSGWRAIHARWCSSMRS